jgi:dCTP deaminase
MFLTDAKIAMMFTGELPERCHVITPFVGRQEEKPSRGLSCCGYDLTLGKTFKRYNSVKTIDCRNPPPDDFYEKIDIYDVAPDRDNPIAKGAVLVEPNEFILGHTEEYIKMPRDLVGFIMDKSSLIRLGLCVFNTVIEPGWEGNITLEIKNNNHVPIIIEPGMGICQIMFAKLDGVPQSTYKELSGKYQGQTGCTVAK